MTNGTDAGMTLVETLAALVVLAGALVLFDKIYFSTLRFERSLVRETNMRQALRRTQVEALGAALTGSGRSYGDGFYRDIRWTWALNSSGQAEVRVFSPDRTELTRKLELPSASARGGQ